jgi:hypothetical protein
MERETILHVLREMRWNKSKAAARLGLSRMQLYGRMRKYSLQERRLLDGMLGEGSKMVAWDGIEPPTRGFSVRCSTS